MAECLSPLLQLVPLLLGQLDKEFSVPADAERKFQLLRESIRDIERFLKIVNSMEDITDDLKASVTKARECLYVFENAIDDFTQRENHRGWEGFICVLHRCFRRRTFASEAGEILPMVDDIRTIMRDAIMEDGLSGNDAQSGSAGHLLLSIAYSDEVDEDLVAIDQSKNDLVKVLNSAEPTVPTVIFVRGAPGVGKTSLVGAVLREKNVKNLFKYYVWIEDLRSCESRAAALMEANTKIWRLSMAGGENEENLKDLKLKDAFKLMKEDNDLEAKTKRWALVMDDASTADVFKSLQSQLNRTHPSILVTTKVRSLCSRSRRVFKSLKYAPHEFERVPLTKEESQHLIRKYIDGDDSHRIWEKCGGLPLRILAMCDLLNCQQSSVTGVPDDIKWKKMSGRLGEALPSNGREGSRIRSMRATRMSLHDVNACLLYLSVFPFGSLIRCSTMMRLWMAERLIEHRGAQTVQEKVEETAEKLLDDHKILENETTGYGRVKTCGVHPNLHGELIIKSGDEEFAMIVCNREQRWPENVWHLSFQIDMDGTYNYMWVEGLRSLLVFKGVYLGSLQNVLEKAQRLKVLHLQSHSTNEENSDHRAFITFPLQILQLKYLRYLSLRDTQVDNIPKDINNLRYLETLDLRGTHVRALPQNLKLKALRHLLVYNRVPVEIAPVESAQPKIIRLWRNLCRDSLRTLLSYTTQKLGVKAPSKLGDLTSLQKLCMIEVEPVRRKGWMKELGKLTNLRKLGLSMLKSTDWEPLFSSIEKLTNLEGLQLIGAEGQKIELAKTDKRKALEYLHRVHLTGHLENLPGWILPRDSLVKLVLKGSKLKEDPLQDLGNFSCLKHLELEEAFDVERMEFDKGQFKKLCFLGLKNFGRLVSIEVDEEALPSLKRLCIARCTLLTEVPKFIAKRIRNFEHLEFCEMHNEFEEWANQGVIRNYMTLESSEWNVPTPVVERVRGEERQRKPWKPACLKFFMKSSS